MSNLYTTKKALKIATALYMVTDIMSEKEPLKWHLRTCAVALLEANTRNIKQTIEQTLDILIIAKIARAISAMNATVLEEELTMLLSQSTEAPLQEDVNVPLFQKDFFEVKLELESKASIQTAPAVPIKDTPKIIVPEAIVPKEIKKIEPRQLLDLDDNGDDIYTPKKETIKEERRVERPFNTLIPEGIRSAFTPRITLVDDDIIDRTAKIIDTKGSRRELILKVISEKDNCSIKDIATKISDVSEKTIQRELVAMTEEGILRKEGDRRWSTYSISR